MIANQLTFGSPQKPQISPRGSETNSAFRDIIPGGNGPPQAQTLDLHRQKSASP